MSYCNFCADYLTCIKLLNCETCNVTLCNSCKSTRGHWDNDEGAYYCENCWDAKVQQYVNIHFSLLQNKNEQKSLVGIGIEHNNLIIISKRGLGNFQPTAAKQSHE